MLAPWLLAAALAGSLDVIEVGGIWGSPGATNATAAWWNPAGLAAGEGTALLVEAGPTLARVTYERTNPDYGPPVDHDGDGVPDPYDYGGTDEIRAFGVVPFVGLRTDLGVQGLGLGVALAVPYARGAKVVDAPGVGSFHLREGQLGAAHGLLAASYRVRTVSFGLSGAVIESRWGASVDVETLSVLQQNAGGLVDYADPQLEDRSYVGTLNFDRLRDRAWTGGAGLRWDPSDRVALSVAFVGGARLENTGPISIVTGCPPETDPVGRAAVVGLGLCDATVPGTGGVAYSLPMRVHGGLVLRPHERLRLEPMGGWVGWSVFDDYAVEAVIPPKSLPDALNPDEAARRLAQDRDWARDSRDTFWVGLDAKWQATSTVEADLRAVYDHPAIPVEAISGNNYDTHTLALTGGARFGLFGPVRLGLSVQQWLMAPRQVDESIFAVTLDEHRHPVRTYYPSAAGHYRGGITRFGVGVELHPGRPERGTSPR